MELATRLGLGSSRICTLWVLIPIIEFEESGRYHAMHHPLLPKPEDMHLLATNPGKVRANAYDMVLNGNEIEEDLFVFTIKRHNS
jgi:aspartyl-tRNA synthetase